MKLLLFLFITYLSSCQLNTLAQKKYYIDFSFEDNQNLSKSKYIQYGNYLFLFDSANFANTIIVSDKTKEIKNSKILNSVKVFKTGKTGHFKTKEFIDKSDLEYFKDFKYVGGNTFFSSIQIMGLDSLIEREFINFKKIKIQNLNCMFYDSMLKLNDSTIVKARYLFSKNNLLTPYTFFRASKNKKNLNFIGIQVFHKERKVQSNSVTEIENLSNYESKVCKEIIKKIEDKKIWNN